MTNFNEITLGNRLSELNMFVQQKQGLQQSIYELNEAYIHGDNGYGTMSSRAREAAKQVILADIALLQEQVGDLDRIIDRHEEALDRSLAPLGLMTRLLSEYDDCHDRQYYIVSKGA